MATADISPGLHTQVPGDEGHSQKDKAAAAPEEPQHPAQQKMLSAVNSRVPLGLWASVWAAHKLWLAKEDSYDHWCLVCQEGRHLLKCDSIECTVFNMQHVRHRLI